MSESIIESVHIFVNHTIYFTRSNDMFLYSGSLFTSPDPNGMTFVDLDEDAKLATTVLIVSSINTNDNITIVSVTDVAGSSSQVDTFLLSTKVIITKKPLNFETVQAYLFVLQ